MAQSDWDVPKTEAGLIETLRRIEECRASGDKAELGNGLLALAHLVKWVRPDTGTDPFRRSNELAVEALEAFREARDAKGQARALVAASGMIDAATRDNQLAEAEELAKTTGDENDIAMVIAARARGTALVDRDKATEMHRQALDIYRRTGNKKGMALCLFSLSISGEVSEKLEFALEGARLNRELGDPGSAARCMTIALMNVEETVPLEVQEAMAREGLQDAREAQNHSTEGLFYGKLATILAQKGEHEEAAKYARWKDEVEELDGLTPLERWENNVEMTKMMISAMKAQGNEEGVKGFEEELKRLKANKPKA